MRVTIATDHSRSARNPARSSVVYCSSLSSVRPALPLLVWQRSYRVVRPPEGSSVLSSRSGAAPFPTPRAGRSDYTRRRISTLSAVPHYGAGDSRDVRSDPLALALDVVIHLPHGRIPPQSCLLDVTVVCEPEDVGDDQGRRARDATLTAAMHIRVSACDACRADGGIS